MSLHVWIAALLTLLSVDTLAIAHLIARGLNRSEAGPAWFDHQRFQRGHHEQPDVALVERIRSARGVIVHPCSYGGDLIEYPVHPGFREDAVLSTLAEIEAL